MTWINDSLQVRPQLVQTHFSSHSYLNLQLFIPSIKKKIRKKGKKTLRALSYSFETLEAAFLLSCGGRPNSEGIDLLSLVNLVALFVTH